MIPPDALADADVRHVDLAAQLHTVPNGTEQAQSRRAHGDDMVRLDVGFVAIDHGSDRA